MVMKSYLIRPCPRAHLLAPDPDPSPILRTGQTHFNTHPIFEYYSTQFFVQGQGHGPIRRIEPGSRQGRGHFRVIFKELCKIENRIRFLSSRMVMKSYLIRPCPRAHFLAPGPDPDPSPILRTGPGPFQYTAPCPALTLAQSSG
ncbi:hypothetical protein LIER_43810 [Lithospermum erythrorhizon]|uniref:Uncharacterized protein n=1 Tax=Lithospermum erythrorhizon TaxID=34254 RepID=A0AAV3QWR7_LITER